MNECCCWPRLFGTLRINQVEIAVGIIYLLTDIVGMYYIVCMPVHLRMQ